MCAQTIIMTGSSWKYLDDGSNQGTAWRNLSYNDNAWATGNAQLGYGDRDESTVISYGNSASDKHLCYYFRKTFNIANPNTNSGIKISLLRDDGAVIYINGQEVVRSNMPSGNINYHTTAISSVSGSAENIFYEYSIPSAVLNSGQNIIAVEVHQRSTASSDVSFDLKMEFEAFDFYKKLPYVLYPGNNNQMMVTWQLNETQTCNFSYGTDTTYSISTISTNEFGNDHQHKILLNNLTPGQKYYYKVSVGNNSVKEGSFNAGSPNTAQDITFFAYGDTRSNPDLHDKVAQRVMLDISQNNLNQTFIINSGDLVSNGDTEGSWDTEFFNKQYPHIMKMLANLPFLAALGNHEGQGFLFKKYFPFPMFTNNRYYYSFDYGPAHIIVIDQEIDYSQGSDEYNWIVNDLSSSNKNWKIAVFHKPGWSAGGHSNSTTVQNTLQPLFEQYNVQIVINGHNHYYSRAVLNGVHHITSGGGGAPLYSPNNSSPHIAKVDQSNHYCKLVITGGTLHFYAIRSNGTQIEDFTLNTQITGVHDASLNNKWYTYAKEGYIFVQSMTKELANVEIYDIFGRRIRKRKNIIKRAMFNINQSGIYFVRFIRGEKFTVKKIIVNK